MTAHTFTREIEGRIITCEVVNTWELNEGDVLLLNGCIMTCGAFEDEVSKWGNTPEYDDKGARWCDAKVERQFTDTIPQSWFKHVDGEAYWRVQGNTLAPWSRIIENVPAS